MRTGCLYLIALISTASATQSLGIILGDFIHGAEDLVNANISSLGALVLRARHTNTPSGFVQASQAPPDTNLSLRLDLTPGNISALEEQFNAISTPGDPAYRQFLTKDQVQSYLNPSNDSVTLVNEWLQSSNITPTAGSLAAGSVQFTIPVSQANQLFATNYSFFTHSKSGQQIVRTLSYSIPEALQGHIKFVHPTTSFVLDSGLLPIVRGSRVNPPKRAKAQGKRHIIKNRQSSDSCDTSVTPQCLQSLYGIPATSSGISTTLGVSGFGGQFANVDDLLTFLSNFSIASNVSQTEPFTVKEIDGGLNTQDPSAAGTEANLDIQYTVGLAADIPVQFISVGNANTDGVEGFLDIIDTLISEGNPPSVLTTSYGFNEEDLTPELASSLCHSYMALGSMGVSVLFASGDGGVGGSQPGASCTEFLPTFPATCPYVTVVGATTGSTNEAAATFSSGGFSNIFGRPSYQNNAVSAYLSSAQLAASQLNPSLFNSTGRGYPDVSAQGQNVQIFVAGSPEGVDGTSCSSPIFASIIALLNGDLAANGLPPLGFLNPLLYNITAGQGLNDITTGSNPGCNTPGFPAASGWDPVTGLGTPRFADLQRQVNALSAPILPLGSQNNTN